MSCVEASEASCTSSGGEYQGDDTSCNALTCDPGTGPIGACCIVGGGAIICSVLHQSHCDQLGGTFQGEGAVCDPNPCLNGDCDSDGDVDVDDLLGVISAWGPCPAAKKSCPEDLDGSGEVDTDDLLLVIYNWGGN